jgi:Flp pilus assembly protein TadD
MSGRDRSGLRGRLRSGLAALIIAALVTAVYWPVTGAGFVAYDDPVYVGDNPRVPRGLTPENVAWAMTTFESFNWHPLTWLSHLAVGGAFGLDPLAHHLANVLLHLASALLLLHLVRALTGSFPAALAVAALFAVHPLHVESVAWVSERKDVLSGFFFLVCLLAYRRYVGRPGWGRYLAMLLTLSLGLMAKSMLVTVPFLLLLLDWWPLGRWASGKDRGGRPLRLLIGEKVPLAAVSAAAGVLTFLAQRGGAVSPLGSVPPAARLGNALLAYVAYLRDAVWPARLACFYPHPLGRISWAAAGLAAAAIAGVTAAVILLRRRAPHLATGWFWYLGMLVPVIGLVQVGLQARADRYTYLPLIGIYLAAAVAVAKALPPASLKRALFIPALLLLALAANRQASTWRDSRSLFGHAIEIDDTNWLAHTNLGSVWATEGRYDLAIGEYRRALAHRPTFARTHLLLAKSLSAAGDQAKAESHYRMAIDLRPDYDEAMTNLGGILFRSGRYVEARALFERALRIRPDSVTVRFNLADSERALGRLDAAIDQYRAGLRLSPGYAEGWTLLGGALIQAGKAAEGLAAVNRAVGLAPADPAVRNELGLALAGLGRMEEAVGAFREALRLEPASDRYRLNLSLALERLGRFEEARQLDRARGAGGRGR